MGRYSTLPTPVDILNPADSGEEKKKIPLLIYGVSSAVGAFAAKLARLSGIGPIIGVAGRGADFAAELVDYVVDYRRGQDSIVAAIQEILAKEGLGSKIDNVLDAISENGSLEVVHRLIDPNGGIVITLLPPKLFATEKENFEWPAGVKGINSAVPRTQSTQKDFGYIWSRYIGRLLEDGRLKGHPFEVVPGGLNGVLVGLQKLKEGKASALKYVYRIEDMSDVPVVKRSKVDGAGEQNSRDQSSQNSHPLAKFAFPSFSSKT